MNAILNVLAKEIPKDHESIPMIIYFINMLGLNVNGFEL